MENQNNTNNYTSKILVIEDDPFLANLLKLRLEKDKFEVIQAKDGEEALKKLKEIEPDLILLDLILPKKSGFEVLEDISLNPSLRNKPVIILSNLGQTADIQRGKQLGAVEYFVKAKISIDDLILKIKEFLQKK
ncbi:MAG: response regulator [Candidatus Paceibacterota bacterium]|jgi:DNA-binding response OmpR family regulator|nr:response regulator [Candidatus Paceibacterota bacterium]HPD55361.1 response regulator [Candidatus Paceibacterota bacterium]HQM34835.1 response regulator [Candidatus Paceibacterota bacterium]HQQ38633.1 response regulator [bacterium]